jgi:AcrR family transcriptional regulator
MGAEAPYCGKLEDCLYFMIAQLYDSNSRMNPAFESPGKRDTKDRIMDVAERLFADQGFAATSLRQITAEAGVNLAAVNYHFKSKEALLSAVIERTLGPINQRRMELVDQIEACSGDGRIDLRDAVMAFMRPAFEAKSKAIRADTMRHFPRLMARVMAEPGEWVAPVLLPALHQITNRFMPLFQRAMGIDNRTTVLWGAQFAIGCMTRCLIAPEFIQTITGQAVPPETPEQMLDRLVAFVVGGMQALAEREKSL